VKQSQFKINPRKRKAKSNPSQLKSRETKLKLTLGRKIETASENLNLLFLSPRQTRGNTRRGGMKKNAGELGINNVE